MARVFISYRRADGVYPVGWLAERLSRLDAVSEVRTAFQDSELRCGDDFPTALEAEIDGCDVLVAVVGPHWFGRRDDGTSRLHDVSDWVGRELGTALAAGKRVLPVRVGGAEPLTRADLPASLAALADLHSVEYASAADLDLIVEDIRSHLEEMDRARARLAGLDRPIEVPHHRFGWRALLAAAAAALAGAVVGLLVTSWGLGDAPQWRAVDGAWVLWTCISIASWAALGTLGHFYLWPRWGATMRIDWRSVGGGVGIVGALLAVQAVAFGISPPIPAGDLREGASGVFAIALLFPWILMLLTSAWTTPTVATHRLGERVRLLIMLTRAGRLAAVVLAVASVPAVVTAVMLNEVVDDHRTTVLAELDEAGGTVEVAALDTDSSRTTTRTDTQLVVFAVFLVALTTGGFTWSRVQLRHQSTELAADVAELPARHRAHAEAHLVDDVLPLRPWWLPCILASPIVVAVVVTQAV